MARYRGVTFHEPTAGNLLSVDHVRLGNNRVADGVVLTQRTWEDGDRAVVKIETTLTREEALRYIRDIAERIGGPLFAARLPVNL